MLRLKKEVEVKLKKDEFELQQSAVDHHSMDYDNVWIKMYLDYFTI